MLEVTLLIGILNPIITERRSDDAPHLVSSHDNIGHASNSQGLLNALIKYNIR